MIAVRTTIAALALSACCGLATAKLPPPTPEEEAKAALAQEQAKEAAAAQAAATARAQERVAQRYIAEMAAKGVTVRPTPVADVPDVAVTTAPGKTPARSDTGQAPERTSTDKGGKSASDATHAGAGKESHQK